MSKLHLTNMDNFNIKARLLNMDMYSQLDVLNSAYKGKVEFVISSDNLYEEDTISIAWTKDDITGLVLPNSDYIDYRRIFRYLYKGNLSMIKLPKNKNNSTIRVDEMDYQCRILNTIVFCEGTNVIIDTDRISERYLPAMIVVEKSSGNNRVYKFRQVRV